MLLFAIFALIIVAASVGVVASRKPIHSALFLLVNFATLPILYIMLEAQFLAAVQAIVYAGAIVVLFLFVVMLIGGGDLGDFRPKGASFAAWLTWPRVTAAVLALVLLAGLGYGIINGQLSPAQGSALAFAEGSVQAIGSALYTEYLLPFELTSVLLLIGMIGAIVLARPPDRGSRK